MFWKDGTVEGRDAEFLEMLVKDISPLMEAGVCREDILTILGSRSYVKIWKNTPKFLDINVKTPKGAKWRDARKFKGSNGTTKYLPWGDDLYIKFSKTEGVVGCRCGENPTCRVRNYRNYTAREFNEIMGLESAERCSEISTLWKGLGLRQGFTTLLRSCGR